MRTLDKIKLVRSSINCTYDEARKALIINSGNVIQAIKYIETKYARRAIIAAILFMALSFFGLSQLDKFVMTKKVSTHELKIR